MFILSENEKFRTNLEFDCEEITPQTPQKINIVVPHCFSLSATGRCT